MKSISLLIKQSLKYRTLGFGLIGSLLKHSLYPLKDFKRILPGSGSILDLGSGEGMLTHLLSEVLPGVKFHAVDLNKQKIEQAKQIANKNVIFEDKDILECEFANASAVIFNDVLHHHPFDKQEILLQKAYGFLDAEGIILLKEVDATDKKDVRWTSFWDQKLYPEDKLCFRKKTDWQDVLHKVGFRFLESFTVKHFWIASRTVVVATKKSKLSKIDFNTGKIVSSEPLKVLVSGATGFIGEHLVRELLLNGIKGQDVSVSLIVRNPDYVAHDLKECQRTTLISMDLVKAEAKKKIFDSYDYVYHLASRVDYFGGKDLYDENVLQVKNLIEMLPRDRLKRFIYASTMGAIDRNKKDRCQNLLDENSAAYPTSLYGKSKLEGERIVKESGLPYTLIRIPWCYGPGMSKTHHVRVLCEKALKGSLALKINWPGKVSIIDVYSLSKIFCNIIGPQFQNETYFVSDGEPISFGELFYEMGKAYGLKTGRISVPSLFFKWARLLRFMLPFQLKSLLMDVLAVSNRKIRETGLEIETRKVDFLLSLARYISEQHNPSRFRSKVLLTGVASGIGEALAKQFFAKGYSTILVDKNESDLIKLAEQLQSDYKIIDLSEKDQLKKLYGAMEAEPAIEIVINNAGIGSRGDFYAMDKETIRKILMVNCLAPLYMVRAVLPRFIEEKRGTIINIISSSAFQPLPYMAVYSASKAFLLHCTNAITGEILGGEAGRMEVISFSPSGTATNFQKMAGVKGDPDTLLKPDFVASQIMRCIGKGNQDIVLGKAGKLMRIASKMPLEKLQLKIWGNLMRKMR